MMRPLLDLILYLALATLIVAGLLVIGWAVSRERRRDDTDHDREGR